MAPIIAGARFAFPAAVVWALVACAPGGGEEGERAPGLPAGFELAKGQTSVAAEHEPADTVIDLTAEQLRAKISDGNVRLIDVRTDAEVADGVIPGAEHIALDRFDPALLGADDGREIVLYCRSGRRSAIASRQLAEHTGQPAQHLAGGINAWTDAGLAVAPLGE